jgi:diacylglycerol kinase (ATP)
LSRWYYFIPPKKREALKELERELREVHEARPFDEKSLPGPDDRVVVYGGDGSLNHALNRLWRPAGEVLPTLIYLPGGTANDFIRALGNFRGEEPSEWLNKCLKGETRRLPLVRCNDRVFINVASGLNAADITTQSSREEKNKIGRISYYIKGLTKLSDLKPYPCLVHGEQKILLGFLVSNGVYAGGGIKVKMDSEISQEDFDVLLIGENTGFQLLNLLVKLQREEPDFGDLAVWPFRAKKFRLAFEEEVQVNLDGEAYKSRDFEFEEIPFAVNFLLPPEPA